MRRKTLLKHPTVFSGLVCLAGLFVCSAGAFAQTITITDVPEADDTDTITVFTPQAAAPSIKFVQVDAATTGSVITTRLGLNGALFGNDSWTGPATGIMFNDGPNAWTGLIDVAQEPNLIANSVNAITLRAFAFSADSGYDASTQVRAALNGFADTDATTIFLDIRDANTVDGDGNGIPGAGQLSSVAVPGGGPLDFEVTPDPSDPDDPTDPDYAGSYVVERRIQSISSGTSPSFLIVNKRFVSRFQFYELSITTPNLAWFKANFAGIPEIDAALNGVLMIRAESNPDFLLDNFVGRNSADPALSPERDILGEFSGGKIPQIFLNVAIMLETSAGVWTELDLSDTAPLFIQVRGIALNGATEIQVSRYASTALQSSFDTDDIHVIGDGTGWTRLEDEDISGLSFNGSTSAFTMSESVRTATYGVFFGRGSGGGDSGGGGGGGGGCFIATAAYGTPMAAELEPLRVLRDEHLLNHAMGAAFVDLYYRVSPTLADAIAQRPVLRAAARATLAPIVLLSGFGPSGIVAIVLGMVCAYATYRRRRQLVLRRINRD